MGKLLLRLCSPQAVSMRVSSKPALKLRYTDAPEDLDSGDTVLDAHP